MNEYQKKIDQLSAEAEDIKKKIAINIEEDKKQDEAFLALLILFILIVIIF